MTDYYTFLPWVRQGAVSVITTPDPLNDTLDSRVQLPVSLRLKDVSRGVTSETTTKLRLYGPGDVIGFDARQVIRTEPPHLTPDFTPTYFPFIEFDRPDFPWLFTPAAANSQNQLRPWICLVVVEKKEEKLKLGQPLPVLNIANPQQELPDLSEAWAWAHAQVAGANIDQALQTYPERTLSRLFCPRKLQPNTRYLACVVPTFEVGRKAGLPEERDGTGETIAELKPAWDAQTTPLQLPVYYHWEFNTGAAGDFEDLVWLLKRRRLPSTVGVRKIEVINPDPGGPQATPPRPAWPELGHVLLEGALRPCSAATADDPLKDLQSQLPYQDFQEKLRQLLNQTEGMAMPPGLPVAPPVYGCWHAAQRQIPEKEGDAVWLRDLNLNPSHRAVAALGTQIVQDRQEELMTSAWEQVGEIEKANQALRQAQLARSASTMLYQQQLKPMDPATLLSVTRALHTRVLLEEPQNPAQSKTIAALLQNSCVPPAVVQGTFRRLTGPRSPLARRFGSLSTGEIINRLNDEPSQRLEVVPPRRPPNGMVTLDEMLKNAGGPAQRFCEVTPALLEARIPSVLNPKIHDILTNLEGFLTKYKVDPTQPPGSHLLQARETLIKCIASPTPPLTDLANKLDAAHKDLSTAQDIFGKGSKEFDELTSIRDALDEVRARLRFGIAAGVHQQSMENCDPVEIRTKPRLPLTLIITRLLKQTDPEVTICNRIKARLSTNWQADDCLDPIMVAPVFPTPMYKPLANLSQDFLLPGLEHVPPNTITALVTNPRFIEAYMVGLNHEMSRELLWRGFPTDQRGTYFRQFWDSSSRVPAPTDPEALHDIKPIHQWDAHALGCNLGGDNANSKVVLLIRGDLLRRFPHAIIYMAKATWAKDDHGRNIKPRSPIKLATNGDGPVYNSIHEKYPIFQGTLPPDITFLGFELEPAEARGGQEPDPNVDNNVDNAGWFFVIQQPPTGPRYGLDEKIPEKLTGTWRDLAWENVVDTANTPDPYIKLADWDKLKNCFSTPPKPPNVSWGNNSTSAAIAFITLQGPFRAAIHASDLLYERGPDDHYRTHCAR